MRGCSANYWRAVADASSPSIIQRKSSLLAPPKPKRTISKTWSLDSATSRTPPIEPESVDLVILSQALHHAEEPAKAIAGAHRILKPGGQLLVLDLAGHHFENAHEFYGDRWLGFAESDLHRWLEGCGFKRIEISIVAREEQPPHFETILAGAVK